VPSLAVLRPGVVTVFENEGAVKKFFVSSGSVTINEDASVQILAEEAHPLEDLVLEFSLIYRKFSISVDKCCNLIWYRG
jgi:F0F1-type ATP synthase epsilon subunit